MCTKEEVCALQRDKATYRVARDEIENWAEKYDILCGDPKLLTYALALGLLLSLSLLPLTYTLRKPIYCTFIMVSIVS